MNLNSRNMRIYRNAKNRNSRKYFGNENTFFFNRPRPAKGYEQYIEVKNTNTIIRKHNTVPLVNRAKVRHEIKSLSRWEFQKILQANFAFREELWKRMMKEFELVWMLDGRMK